MPKIYEMSPHLADLIAAGEVVERPASVVKELTENSVDAGAGSITVEIKSGGMAEIRVTDDGCGIAAEDVETAFLRHATSKLRTERDLEAIGTLGFRGEALAAIASVSRIELLTRERGAAEGTRLKLEAGVKTDRAPAGVPEGTTVYVRDLFFNTPARQKFMKNDRAEGSAVTTAVVRLALSHPEISVRYIRDGKEEYHTPGDGNLQSAAYTTLGREFARGLLTAENTVDGIGVSGFVSTPAAARGNRAWQFFFLNGRFIKSKLLQAAVEQAYKNSLFTGRFPVCLLDVAMSPAAVDVNVHPTKLEVRFADERAVFDAVYWAVRGALDREEAPRELTISKSTLSVTRGVDAGDIPGNKLFAPSGRAAAAAPAGGFMKGRASGGGDFFKSVPAGEYRPSGDRPPSRPAGAREDPAAARATGPKTQAAPKPVTVTFRDVAAEPEQTGMDLPERPAAGPEPEAAPRGDGWRYVGEALDTYIIVERGESLILIDKHAAHERMLFDGLRSRKYENASQLLLTPVVCKLGEEAAGTVMENREFLEELGFELSDFGGGSIALRATPIDMDLSDPGGLLEEIADKLASGGRRDVEAMRDDVLHTVACKAAIKAGRRTDPGELTGLIEAVLTGRVRYCPHGRPVMAELTKNMLDRSFKRA